MSTRRHTHSALADTRTRQAAARVGDDVLLEWTVDDKYPNDPATVVSYKGATVDWPNLSPLA